MSRFWPASAICFTSPQLTSVTVPMDRLDAEISTRSAFLGGQVTWVRVIGRGDRRSRGGLGEPVSGVAEVILLPPCGLCRQQTSFGGQVGAVAGGLEPPVLAAALRDAAVELASPTRWCWSRPSMMARMVVLSARAHWWPCISTIQHKKPNFSQRSPCTNRISAAVSQ